MAGFFKSIESNSGEPRVDSKGLEIVPPRRLSCGAMGKEKAGIKEKEKKTRKKSETAASEPSIGLLPVYPTALR